MQDKVERQKGLKRGAFEEERQGRETREARDGREGGQGREKKRTEERGT